MVERGSNIDFVFRNGLKDFEVLPPHDVWDNIHPVMKRRNNSVILLKYAALFTAVMTMSFLAYRWSTNLSTKLSNTTIALNERAVSPEVPPSIEKTLVTTKNRQSLKPGILLSESIPDNPAETKSENTILPDLTNTLVPDNLPISNVNPSYEQHLVSINSSKKKVPELSISDQEYTSAAGTMDNVERWSIAALASPTYYERFNSSGDGFSELLAESENPVISYTGGIAFSYEFNSRFSIRSGLFYSSVGQEVTGVNSYSGFKPYVDSKGSSHNFEVLTTNGTLYANNADVFLVAGGSGDRIITNFNKNIIDPEKENLQYISNTLHQNFSYVELPISLKYKVIDKNIDFNLIGGVSYNLLVNNSVYTVTNGDKYQIGKTEGLNTISISSSIGMGMEYKLSKNILFNLEPTFRYYLNPFSEVSGTKIHPYSIGIFSGLSYKF